MAMKSSPSCEDRENYSWQTAPYVPIPFLSFRPEGAATRGERKRDGIVR